MSQDNGAALEWLQKFHAAGDSLSVDAWTPWFTEDSIVSVGNNPTIQGRDNFLKLYAHQAHVLDLMKHDITHFDVVGDRIYHQTSITYKVKGDASGQTLNIPAISIVHRNGEQKIYKLEIYVDNTPLMAKVKEAMAAKAQASASA
ncbi:NTF2-like protein [Stereum hirsutum FP-91666 SS1]|uniref:NTF2-like protein n=1 Tax=Stereum hirsutum (strain FP-91666) TaxID=721885 RepID=UPI0004409DB1|nr:NTF2-like protein [Stereum hirsutum FP-91666 SS1]EIM89966.1 NTF2-like protein [Stereum hirsutum FP-91666 SS1]